jgi:hypothetical protein
MEETSPRPGEAAHQEPAAGEPPHPEPANKAAAGDKLPSTRGGYKSRRSGVRLEGHIDHILRRRIVLRERELIPQGLRPELAMSLGTVRPPEKKSPSVGFHPWAEQSAGELAGSQGLSCVAQATAKNLEHFGAAAGFHDFRQSWSSAPSHAGAHGGAASPHPKH